MNRQLSPAKNLALLMHDVSRLLRHRLDREAQALGLTSAQWRVLSYTARCEGTNQASLADFMDMEPITLSRQLDRMESAGMIERRRDPNDRRAHQLYLTDAGRELIGGFRSIASGVMREATEGVGDDEIDIVVDVLSRMRGNITGKSAEQNENMTSSGEKVSVQ